MRPKVAVLLAAFNGLQWLENQVMSILAQKNVDVTLFVSVDVSTDGTEQLVDFLSIHNAHINVLPHGIKFGGAGLNFYRLICDVDASSFDYVAFADQDDIWNLDKLSRHVGIIETEKAECVSSNVIAFWPDGSQKLICKAQSQKKFDFIFEAAGPGCSFLMTPWLVAKIREQIQSPSSIAKYVELHDWLTYAICRAYKRKWVIDNLPSLMYRQHGNNLIGANTGLKAIFSRLKKMYLGQYRAEVIKICEVCLGISSDLKLIHLLKLLKSRSLISRFKLLFYVTQARRKVADRIVLSFAILFGIF